MPDRTGSGWPSWRRVAHGRVELCRAVKPPSLPKKSEELRKRLSYVRKFIMRLPLAGLVRQYV